MNYRGKDRWLEDDAGGEIKEVLEVGCVGLAGDFGRMGGEVV